MIRTAVIALAAVALLAGCSPAEPAPEPIEPRQADTIEPPDRPLDQLAAARAVAQEMDPVFADDTVWDATQSVAQTMCSVVDADPDSAGVAILLLADEAGVTAEQVGIIWGIASNVYCPEHLDKQIF